MSKTTLFCEGDRIADRYEILGLLGEGASGTVFLCRQVSVGRLVAVKVLTRFDDAESLALFGREIRALAQIDHPGIVAMYECDIWRNTPFIVMAYVDGGSLGERLRSGPLSANDVVRLGVQTGRALEAAHRVGIVHRDIKPDNILLDHRTGSLEARLTDFGLAKLDSGARNSRILGGTPYYMAPEQAVGGAVDHRADLYALACTLWHALEGAPPFRAAEAMQLIEMHRHAPRPPLSMGASATSELLCCAMAVDPADRPTDASAFVEGLVAAMSDDMASADATGTERPAFPRASTTSDGATASDPRRSTLPADASSEAFGAPTARPSASENEASRFMTFDAEEVRRRLGR